MPHCQFNKESGIFLGGSRWQTPAHDPLTEVVIKLSNYPNARAERWDGATGLRAATAQEMAVLDKIAAKQRANNQATLIIAELFVDLIASLLTSNTIVAADFDTETRQQYQTLKGLVDDWRAL